MTVRRRIVAGIEDIKSVSLECTKCGTLVTFAPDTTQKVPEACHCGQSWRVPGILADNFKPIDFVLSNFVESIPIVRKALRESPPGFRISLEFDEPSR